LVGLDDARRRVMRVGGRLHLCTDDGSRGSRGNVVRLLERVAPRLPGPIVIHACGPHAMLKAVAGWALSRGVEAWLAMESVMACGTGVCRGCPLPRSAAGRAAFGNRAPSLEGNRELAMCCTEGPVFESHALDWDQVH
jgi:dihydroorotate dehydrogenase electron transfer subunit